MMRDQRAIVTGASRGIGRAIALALAAQGARILLHGTDSTLLQALAGEIPGALWVAGDVADPDTAAQAVATAESAWGGVDILVNNAGINTRSPTLDMPFADWQRVLDVNLNGTLHFCRAVLPCMIAAQGGRIVNISSTTAKTPHKNAAPAYGASKAAVNYLTLHLAEEMAHHGIRVNAVCPGPVESDMTAEWDDAYRARVSAGVPLGRIGRASEIAEAVLFLAGPGASFITGQTLNANGGTFMA